MFNLRYIIYLVFFILAPNILKAIEKPDVVSKNLMQHYFKISLTKFVDTNFVGDNSLIFNDFIFKSYQNNIYFTNSILYTDGNNSFHLLGNINNNEILKAIINDTILCRCSVSDFVITPDTLILVAFKYILIFTKKNNDYLLEKSINLNCTLEKIHLYDNKIIGYSNNFWGAIGDNEDSVYSYYVTMNLSDLKPNYHILGKQNSSIFTIFQPRYLIAGNKNKIVTIDAIGDSITFYTYNINTNTNTNKRVVYKYKPNNWVSSSKETTDFINQFNTPLFRKYVKNTIDSLRPLMQEISFISKIDFINDSTLLILETSPKENHSNIYDFDFYLDIITFNNNRITKYIQLTQKKQNLDEPLGVNFLSSWYITDSYKYCDRKMIFTQQIPFPITDELYQLTPNQIKDKIKEYLNEHDNLPYQFIVLSLIDN